MDWITQETVNTNYQQVLAEVNLIFPIEQWRIAPTGIGFTKAKTAYGYATIDGRVLVNNAFLDTRAFIKLDYTIRHELAHLAVGLDEQHSELFRYMERLFGVDTRRDLSQEVAQLKTKFTPKYTLYARFANGEVKAMGGAHRRHKKYTNYRRQGRYSLMLDGETIESFFYELNPAATTSL